MTTDSSNQDSLLSLACCNEDDGQHRAVLIVIGNAHDNASSTCSLLGQLNKDFRTFLLESPLPPVDKVTEYSETLRRTLIKQHIKRATIFGIGSGATVAQSLAVSAPKIVRRLVLLDAAPRLAPGFLCRTVDRIERFLPLGLPLRRLRAHYDSRPTLHRIHCPTLLMLSDAAGAYETEQADFIRSRIPNCWFENLHSVYDEKRFEFSSELQEILTKFLQVPVKRPQKNLS